MPATRCRTWTKVVPKLRRSEVWASCPSGSGAACRPAATRGEKLLPVRGRGEDRHTRGEDHDRCERAAHRAQYARVE